MSPPNALPPRTIEVARLACRRGERLLFADLTFTVVPGELLLVRGANGAGKTTLLLALAGILRPEAGTIGVTGRREDDRPGADVHLLSHQPAIKPRLTAAENLQFWADLFAGERRLIAPALETVGLAHIADLEAGHYSAGQTRRLALARLLVADRPIWLLDEPTVSLDGHAQAVLTGAVDVHLAAGGLAVAATHHDIHIPPPANVRTLTLVPA